MFSECFYIALSASTKSQTEQKNLPTKQIPTIMSLCAFWLAMLTIVLGIYAELILDLVTIGDGSMTWQK